MEILLTLTYVAICYAIFKIFRIPVNQWTLATAALGGAKQAAAQAALDTATRNLDAAKQATAEAVAAEDRARQAYGAMVDGEHSAIVRFTQ